MNLVTTLFFVLICAFVVAFLLGFAKKPPDPIRAMKERFIALSRLSRAQAEVELLDRVESLADRFPGKSYHWYWSGW